MRPRLNAVKLVAAKRRIAGWLRGRWKEVRCIVDRIGGGSACATRLVEKPAGQSWPPAPPARVGWPAGLHFSTRRAKPRFACLSGRARCIPALINASLFSGVGGGTPAGLVCRAFPWQTFRLDIEDQGRNQCFAWPRRSQVRDSGARYRKRVRHCPRLTWPESRVLGMHSARHASPQETVFDVSRKESPRRLWSFRVWTLRRSVGTQVLCRYIHPATL